MTQRRRRRRARRGRFGRRAFLAGAGCAALAGAAVLLGRGQTASASSVPPTDEAEPNAALPSGEWRAVWVSYLEWAGMDFSSEEAFRAGAAELMDNCLSIGLNTVIAQVRPFGDALYRSTLFPWSHLCTGEQGQDPGFDPLDVLITEAHSRGLSLEAWVNPYRLRSSAKMPPALAENNLANVHPEWVCAVGEGLYLNPAIPEAADYVVKGVAELVQNYAVDGIHFDDYFYPTTDAALDAAQFAASGAGDLAAWRRQNVTALVKAAHDAVKAADPTLRFGVSPQGNPRQRPRPAVQRRESMAGRRGRKRRGGLPLPADILGLRLYPPVGQHPLRLREHRAGVAGHAPGGIHGPLLRAGGLSHRRGRRRCQRGQPEPVVYGQRSCPAGGKSAQPRRGRMGALPVRFAVPVGSAGACRRRTCGAGRSDYSLNSCMEKQNAVYYINRVKPRVKTKFEDKRS